MELSQDDILPDYHLIAQRKLKALLAQRAKFGDKEEKKIAQACDWCEEPLFETYYFCKAHKKSFHRHCLTGGREDGGEVPVGTAAVCSTIKRVDCIYLVVKGGEK